MFSAELEKPSPSQWKLPIAISTGSITVSRLEVVLTVVVADAAVEINLGVIPFAFGSLETSPQHMAVVDADVLSGVVEGHVG